MSLCCFPFRIPSLKRRTSLERKAVQLPIRERERRIASRDDSPRISLPLLLHPDLRCRSSAAATNSRLPLPPSLTGAAVAALDLPLEKRDPLPPPPLLTLSLPLPLPCLLPHHRTTRTTQLTGDSRGSCDAGEAGEEEQQQESRSHRHASTGTPFASVCQCDEWMYM